MNEIPDLFNNFAKWSGKLGITREEESFLKLVALGQYSVHSYEWINLFKKLECLHLLVLSGSQVQGLGNALRFVGNFLTRGLAVKKALVLSHLFCCVFLGYYAIQTGANPPIVRATFYYFLASGPWRFPLFVNLLGSLALHILFFPHQFESRSFYLSWTAFLIIILVSKLNISQLLSRILSTFLCLLILQFFFFSEKQYSMIYALFSNTLLILLFDRYLQRPLSAILAAIMLGTFIPQELGDIFFDGLALFCAPFFRAIMTILLVALGGIRYIG